MSLTLLVLKSQDQKAAPDETKSIPSPAVLTPLLGPGVSLQPPHTEQFLPFSQQFLTDATVGGSCSTSNPWSDIIEKWWGTTETNQEEIIVHTFSYNLPFLKLSIFTCQDTQIYFPLNICLGFLCSHARGDLLRGIQGC